MSKFIVGDRMLQALYDTGILGDDYTSVRRIVIDLEYGKPARLYVEKYADNVLHDVVLSGGIEIVETAAEAGRTGAKAPRPSEDEAA